MTVLIPEVPATTIQALHPWITTPEALRAAEQALKVHITMFPKLSARVGAEELQRQALRILTECALPSRELPGSVLSRAVGGGHVGQMHVWPAGERVKYAIREIGYQRGFWLREQHAA
jgi:hypothetical protein